MTEIAFELRGLTPLVMHNGQLADPDGESASVMRPLQKKRGKSPEERAELSRLEWQGGLYFDEKIGPYVPDQNILGALVEGARFNKQGKDVNALVGVTEPFVPLDYKGPRTLEAMWNAGMLDKRVVSSNGKPGGPKVVRTRPLFKDWALKFSVYVDDEMNPDDVVEAMKIAGKRVGLCERKKFRWGRFEIVKARITK